MTIILPDEPGPGAAAAAWLGAVLCAALAVWAWARAHDAARLLPRRLAWLGTAAAAASAALLGVSVAARSAGPTSWAGTPLAVLAAAALVVACAAVRTRRDVLAGCVPGLSDATVPGVVVRASATWQREAWAGVVRWRQGLRDAPEPAHRHGSGRRRGLVGSLALLALAAMLVNGLLGYHAAGVVVSQYATLAGLSLLLASTPGVVTAWLAIVLVSGRPRIGASLAMAGDYAGRGLVCGFVVGIAAFALDRLAEQTSHPVFAVFRATEMGDWLTTLLTLSATGTMIGFALSQLRLLDLACRACRYPKVAWLAAPLLVFVALALVSGLLLDPRRIYIALAADVVRGLPPIPSSGLTDELVLDDSRYAFAADQTGPLAAIPDPLWLAALWAAAAAAFLWGMEWKGSRVLAFRRS
ncbi:hypothetical protein GCM10012320_07720 [Sinomonas cellulolyticus]|uniref:Uncharacterized protein n=1 Tax=Sinomonas cellulolyticus TaxID=2801916 RepID=A0ABS1K409_9MICC|nr:MULTISPECIES: hypothetical protein [Sinomonas]MBL0706097.1 hypothetical protein [Sinomonas cellulolyticus]GHG43460.1 hypothetical protein GCM10012320_07720 [Sinomonas sp. KCTC 49339]